MGEASGPSARAHFSFRRAVSHDSLRVITPSPCRRLGTFWFLF